MKALIAAGGRATRLRPITWTTNKHLIPLAGKPMLWHVIDKIAEAGIDEIIINVNPGEVDLMRDAFGDGSHWGVTLTYLEQKGGARGVAHVVANALPELGNEPFLFYLGDNIILGSIKKFVDRFREESLDCMLAFSRVPDPTRFGVPEFNADGELVCVHEKPAEPPSDFAVTGIYLYNGDYAEAFKSIEPSERGEYEISDINTWYVKNRKVEYEEITGWWKDTGTPAALIEGNALIMDDLGREEFVCEGTPEDPTVLQGMVKVGKGSTISADCLIRGPVTIGEGCEITASYIGPYTSIGDRVSVKNAQIEHSIIFDGVQIDSTPRIVDSLIGKDAVLTHHKTTHPKTGHRMVVGDNSFLEL